METLQDLLNQIGILTKKMEPHLKGIRKIDKNIVIGKVSRGQGGQQKAILNRLVNLIEKEISIVEEQIRNL